MLKNKANHKLSTLTLLSLVFSALLFQSCSPVKLGIKYLGLPDSNFSEGLSYAPKSVSGRQVITNGNVVLKEYRHKASNRYFYTSRINDQSLLETTYASLFEVTGNTITLKVAGDAGLSPVYRLFNKAGFHVYTAEINDRSSFLTDTKFQDEGIEGYAVKINPQATCPTTPVVTYPVNRLFHASNDKYRLATSEALRNQLTAKGYVDQGILFCATDVSKVAPVVGVCGSLPTGYATSICSGFYKSTGNAQVVNYCDCVNNDAKPINQACTLGTTSVAHGATVSAYQAASVTAPATCQSQTKTCNNAVLTATTRTTENFLYAGCTVVPSIIVPPAGPVTCTDQDTDLPYVFDGNYDSSPAFTPRTFKNAGQLTASFEIIPGAYTVTAGYPDRYNRFTWEIIGPDLVGGFTMTISPCRGDFTSSDALKISSPGYTPPDKTVEYAGSIAIYFDESVRVWSGTVFAMALTSNRHWYINVRNDQCPEAGRCGTGFGFKHALR